MAIARDLVRIGGVGCAMLCGVSCVCDCSVCALSAGGGSSRGDNDGGRLGVCSCDAYMCVTRDFPLLGNVWFYSVHEIVKSELLNACPETYGVTICAQPGTEILNH